MGTISEVTAAPVTEPVTETPTPVEAKHVGLIHRLLTWTEAEFHTLGVDISAEIAAIRAKI